MLLAVARVVRMFVPIALVIVPMEPLASVTGMSWSVIASTIPLGSVVVKVVNTGATVGRDTLVGAMTVIMLVPMGTVRVLTSPPGRVTNCS